MRIPVFENVLMVYARRCPLRRGKLRIINSLWQVAIGDRNTHRVADLKYGRFRMPCDVNEMLQRQFYFFGTYFTEEQILNCWSALAKGAKVVLDVGANGGIFSLAALASQPDAVVHAFEPTPEIADRLRATAKLNGLDQLYIHEVAVATRNGYATLRRFRGGELGTNEGMNFITFDEGDLRDLGESGFERVQTVGLDQFCQHHEIDHIDLLKLDIQGHEHSALVGAEHLIRTGRIEIIFTELNWADVAGSTCPATQSIRLLEQAGYRFSRPGRRLNWQKAGNWLETLTEVVASRKHV